MRIRVQVIIESDHETAPPHVKEVACFERGALTEDSLGLRLDEAKQLLAGIQQAMSTQQVEDYVEQQRQCSHCQQVLTCKGHHQIGLRTLFGKLTLSSPRLYTCSCQPQEKRSWSPVATLFSERSTPELLCLEVRWASLMSYGLTVGLLGDLLPMDHQLSTSNVSRHVHQVAERLEQELGEEQSSFIEGCPAQWYDLPEPAAPLTVSLDGGYVHARSPEHRKDGSFEVIVGKSTTGEGATTSFGLVSGYPRIAQRGCKGVVNWQKLCLSKRKEQETYFLFGRPHEQYRTFTCEYPDLTAISSFNAIMVWRSCHHRALSHSPRTARRHCKTGPLCSSSLRSV